MRNVIVTGGSRGLGLAIARKLRLAGYCVVAVARRRGDTLAAAMQESEGADVGALHFRPFDLGEIGFTTDVLSELQGQVVGQSVERA